MKDTMCKNVSYSSLFSDAYRKAVPREAVPRPLHYQGGRIYYVDVVLFLTLYQEGIGTNLALLNYLV